MERRACAMAALKGIRPCQPKLSTALFAESSNRHALLSSSDRNDRREARSALAPAVAHAPSCRPLVAFIPQPHARARPQSRLRLASHGATRAPLARPPPLRTPIRSGGGSPPAQRGRSARASLTSDGLAHSPEASSKQR
eukprot:1254271-Pleurochrysis_carterae.AAC.2